MTIDSELRVNKLNTAAFIAAKPVSLVLTPRTKEPTDTNGTKWVVGAPKTAQTLRIIEISARVTPPILQLTNGTERQVEFELLGPFDANIAAGDFWVADDTRVWEVGDIVRPNGYETRALVAERG